MQVTLKGNFATQEVWLNGKLLSLGKSLSLRNHSPTGFSWGYVGSGPAQLALAILLECMDKTRALEFYQEFKWNVVAELPNGDFDVKDSEIP